MHKKLLTSVLCLCIAILTHAQMTPVVPPELPRSISFAGEKVPLENWDVRERLDREMLSNCFMHSKTLHILKLANRYERDMKAILKRNAIPEDFFYLCVAESALRNQRSPAGAQGMWQFMSATARTYGLEVNSYVDERNNWKLATEAACQYLRDAYRKFGNWTEAAASYNMGMGGLNSRMSKQSQRDYYNLVLPGETERYIFRIIAFKIIMSNPSKYGFQLKPSDLYPKINTRSEVVTYGISNLMNWAIQKGTTFRMLTELNPWLTSTYLTNNSGKRYIIELPMR